MEAQASVLNDDLQKVTVTVAELEMAYFDSSASAVPGTKSSSLSSPAEIRRRRSHHDLRAWGEPKTDQAALRRMRELQAEAPPAACNASHTSIFDLAARAARRDHRRQRHKAAAQRRTTSASGADMELGDLVDL